MAFNILIDTQFEDLPAPNVVHFEVDPTSTFDGVADYKDLQYEWEISGPSGNYTFHDAALSRLAGEEVTVLAKTGIRGISGCFWFDTHGEHTITCRTHSWNGSSWTTHTTSEVVDLVEDTTTEAVYYDPDATGANNGTSPTDAYTTLEAGITKQRQPNKRHLFHAGKSFTMTSNDHWNVSNSRWDIYGGTARAAINVASSGLFSFDNFSACNGLRLANLDIGGSLRFLTGAGDSTHDLLNIAVFKCSFTRNARFEANNATRTVKGGALIDCTWDLPHDVNVSFMAGAIGANTQIWIHYQGCRGSYGGWDDGGSHGFQFARVTGGGAQGCGVELKSAAVSAGRGATNAFRIRNETDHPCQRIHLYHCWAGTGHQVGFTDGGGDASVQNSRAIVIDACIAELQSINRTGWISVGINLGKSRDARVRNFLWLGSRDTSNDSWSWLAGVRWAPEGTTGDEDYLLHVLGSTILVTSNTANTGGGDPGAAIQVLAPAAGTNYLKHLEVEGNILLCDYLSGGTTTERAWILNSSVLGALTTKVVDHNVYRCEHVATTAFRARIPTTDYTAIADWRTALGGDADSAVAASIDFDPDWVPGTDLQLMVPVRNGMRTDLLGNQREVVGGEVFAGAIDAGDGGGGSPVQLQVPTDLALEALVGGLRVTWTDANSDPNEDGTEVWVKVGAGDFELADTLAADAETTDLTGLPEEEHTVRVRAIGDGVATLDSEFSDEVSETPLGSGGGEPPGGGDQTADRAAGGPAKSSIRSAKPAKPVSPLSRIADLFGRETPAFRRSGR
jgi:hypothetical protein